MKQQALDNAPTSVIIRKCIKLGDMDKMVDETQKKCQDLLNTADKIAENLRDQQHKEEIRKNI